MEARPFIFLDRDDTVIYDVPYLNNPDLVRLTPGAAHSLRKLHDAGFGLVLISNQSGVGRGLITMQQLASVNHRMSELLMAEANVQFDGIFFCPHRPDENCNCRKPKTGMLEQACAQFNVDLAHSAMVGDLPNDIKMGRTFHLKTLQIRLAGKEKPDAGADFTAETLAEALPYLLSLADASNSPESLS